MTNEWTDLPTLQDVAKAQADGWEIECTGETLWIPWDGTVWRNFMKYRARPRQPKLRKVKMLAYLDTNAELRWRGDPAASAQWIRIPAQDIEIEVPA